MVLVAAAALLYRQLPGQAEAHEARRVAAKGTHEYTHEAQ